MYDFYSSIGAIKDWIPPIPIYSKTSPDYDKYKNGYYSCEDETMWDDDELVKLIQDKLQEVFEGETDNIGMVADVETRPIVLAHSGLQEERTNNSIVYRGTPNNTIGTISANDIEGLEKMIKSWWQDDDTSKADNQSEQNIELFKDSADSIREQYYNESLIDMSKLNKAFEDGYYQADDEFDPDKMVVDPVSNRPMTAMELQTRELIRHLSKNGWNELRLLQQLGVGGRYELRLLEQKRRNRKIANKKASALVADVIGSDIDIVDDVDSLEQLLFDD